MAARFERRIDALVDDALATFAADENAPSAQELASCRVALQHYLRACSRTRTKQTPAMVLEVLAQGAEQITIMTDKLLSGLAALDKNVENRLAEIQRQGRLQTIAPAPAPAEEKVAVAAKKKTGLFSLGQIKKLLSNTPANTPAQPAPPATPFIKPAPLAAQFVALPWNKDGRIYLQLDDNSQSPIEPVVTAFLQAAGYTVTDYINNRAVDGRKNERKIGKLIKDNEGLLSAYFNDPARASKNLMIVLTCNVHDMARGSVERGWKSCRADPWSAARFAADEANVGGMSAYLVNVNDPEIHDPLARINIKPYDRIIGDRRLWNAELDRNDVIYAPFNPIGFHHPGFVDAIYRLVESLNGDKTGWYRLRDECENYREFQLRRLLPRDGKAALDDLGIEYKQDAQSGKITVDGNLLLCDMGLLRLPDFRDVTFTGHINVSGNRLLTLEGLPTDHAKSVCARNNLLVCLTGAPTTIEEDLDYRDNPWLMSTIGASVAAKYRYGNGQNNSSHYGSGTIAIGPTEQPKRFPGFKRPS